MSVALSNRDSLISSAVGFLQDPAVANSPLAKRIAFLESKGLTPSEIEVALRRASNSQEPHGFGSGYRALQQPYRDATDWRDWFVMTVIGGGVGYLLINLAKKYLIPALKPPTQTDLEEAQAKLEQKYDEVSEILHTIQSDTEIVKKEMTQQTENLDRAMKEVELAVEECLSGEVKRDQELKTIQEEVDALRVSIKEMMQSNKDVQIAAIVDLQTELKSLKSLMASRTGPSSSSGPQPPSTNGAPLWSSQTGSALNTFGLQPPLNSSLPSSKFINPTRPVGIPAWQLASGATGQTSNGDNSSEVVNPNTSTPVATPSTSPIKTNMNGNGNLHDLHDLESKSSAQNHSAQGVEAKAE